MMDDLLQEMIDPAPVHHDAPRRRRLWTTVAIVGLAAIGATSLTTSAIFTDNDATSASIETGTVDLAIGQSVPFTFVPQNLAPGDSTFMPLQILNNGSLALRYATYSAADVTANGTTDPVLDPPSVPGDLRTVLQLSVFENLTDTQCNAAGVAASTRINADSTVSGWTTAARPLLGANTQGLDAGDRELIAGASEWLCFRVDFPSGSGNEFQDTGVTLALTFNAEQVANNP
ncbi:TasA family protein [Cellulomonas sp.]|uniref:TasA family protein n=1 Tax=Cellulomonas sp. TaxID=40001 RepID=UPI003BAB4841